MRRPHVPALALALSSVLLVSACLRPGAPCAGADDCPGRECLASRCVPLGSDPVPAGTERTVLEARQTLVRGGSGAASRSTVTLGTAHGPTEVLYLAFDVRAETRDVVAAFLLLTPSPGTGRTTEDVPLLVREITERWTPERAASGALPALGPARASAIARGRPASTTRIDVTSLVKSRGSLHGLVVVADGVAGDGVTFLSGASGGSPRLEIYARRGPPR